MKTISDYIKTVLESEGAVNVVSSGAIETRDVPLGGVKKRKDESQAYEGDNPLVQNIGKFPLADGATAPDVGDGKDNGHMFKQKQAEAGYTG
jgi:hypothetical protein